MVCSHVTEPDFLYWTTREEREQNPPTAQLEILFLPAHRKNSSQERELATWFLCMSFSNSQGVVSSFPVCLSLVCGLTSPCVSRRGFVVHWALLCPVHSGQPSVSCRAVCQQRQPALWRWGPSAENIHIIQPGREGKGKLKKTEGWREWCLRLPSVTPDHHHAVPCWPPSNPPMHLAQMFTAQGHLCVEALWATPEGLTYPTAAQGWLQHLPALSHLYNKSFPLLPVLAWRCCQCCEGSAVLGEPQRVFCFPCSGEVGTGVVNSRAEHSVCDSVICVFASLAACSRARCFSLLE